MKINIIKIPKQGEKIISGRIILKYQLLRSEKLTRKNRTQSILLQELDTNKTIKRLHFTRIVHICSKDWQVHCVWYFCFSFLFKRVLLYSSSTIYFKFYFIEFDSEWFWMPNWISRICAFVSANCKFTINLKFKSIILMCYCNTYEKSKCSNEYIQIIDKSDKNSIQCIKVKKKIFNY